MSTLAERLKRRYFGQAEHPYTIFEREIVKCIRPNFILLDAGCGRTAPVLAKFHGKVARLIGVDVVGFESVRHGLEVVQSDLGRIPIRDATVDIAMARSVLEHLDDPVAVYREMHRVLKPGGRFIFLTANRWDYASLIATLVPNRYHPWIVAKTEGRRAEDTFPVRYRTNTRRSIARLARAAGFDVASFRYLGQYPSYFMFNGPLFFVATGYEKLLARYEALAPLRGWILAILQKPCPPDRPALKSDDASLRCSRAGSECSAP
jgi:SAM-dependent methyltransferase